MMSRYARQMVLPEVGQHGQRALASATVVVVGAGGLGSVVLQLLAAAGVGRLVIADFDQVEESNLHRQPLYRMQDIGALKVEAARAALLAANPHIEVQCWSQRVTPANVVELIRGADLVLDAADSLAVSYILSDACMQLNQALISASVLGLSGYVGMFCGAAPSYRAVFPDMPSRGGNCASDGVLGTAVSIVASLQAQITLAALLNLQPSPAGRLIRVDCQRLRFSDFDFNGAPEPAASDCLHFIDNSQLQPEDLTIDLRTEPERDEHPFPANVCVPVAAMADLDMDGLAGRRVVLCCRSGLRAWQAALALRSRGIDQLALLALGERASR